MNYDELQTHADIDRQCKAMSDINKSGIMLRRANELGAPIYIQHPDMRSAATRWPTLMKERQEFEEREARAWAHLDEAIEIDRAHDAPIESEEDRLHAAFIDMDAATKRDALDDEYDYDEDTDDTEEEGS